MWDAALKCLRRELRAFSREGLRSLHQDLILGREDKYSLPARRSWAGCPLSYRRGERGSADRDSLGAVANDFTLAWDGYEPDGEYLDEMLVIEAVEAELERRDKNRLCVPHKLSA